MLASQLLNSMNVKQNVDAVILSSILVNKTEDLEFFNVEKNISESEIQKEYESRGLVPANPYALFLYARENPAFAGKCPYGTHWEDQRGRWCHAVFYQWFGKREADVKYSSTGIWGKDFQFVGVKRK